MSCLTSEQEAMNRVHSDDGSTCLPNCWRWHLGDKQPTKECNWCYAQLPIGDDAIHIKHNVYHIAHPETIKKEKR